MPDEMQFDEDAQEHWSKRGSADAEKGRNAVMWPTRDGGVFFDIAPPDHWSPEYARLAAEAYYDAWVTTEPA